MMLPPVDQWERPELLALFLGFALGAVIAVVIQRWGDR
jgi:hypothetical protein